MSNLINDPYQYGILTEIGKKKINASTQEKQLKLTHFVLGDGQGNPVTPVPSGTSLINQIGREPITETKEGFISGGILMTPDMAQKYAGQYIREAGLIDDDGDLIVWCAYAPTQIALTTGRTLMIVMPIVADGTVNVVIDTSRKYASIDDLNALRDQINEMLSIHDFSVHATALADTNNAIYGTLPRYVVASIPAGLIQNIYDNQGRPIFTPDPTLDYVLSITTIKTETAFIQTIVIINSSENEYETNITYQRSGADFETSSVFALLTGLLPNSDLVVDTLYFKSDVRAINL